MKPVKAILVEEDSDLEELSSEDSSISRINNNKISDRLDLLVFKVEKIEESQDKIIDRLGDINESLYEPDKGLYARIKGVETKSGSEVSELKRDIKEIRDEVHEQKDSIDEVRVSQRESSEIQKKISDNLGELVKWKSSINGSVKWVIASIITPIAGLLLKYFFG